MIISPPFLPESGLTSTDASKPDPMMDAVDKLELAHGIYPIAFDGRWHCGVHLAPNYHGAVHSIADGEVVAYRVCQHAMDSGNGNAGFVLLRHKTETGDGRTLTFYSLYMHLLPLAEYQSFGHDGARLPAFLRNVTGQVPQGAVGPAVAGGGRTVRRKDVIGFLGRYQNVSYTHFEIFMMPRDFDTYFGRTQLGNAHPLAFIRHFRRSAWFSKEEFEAIYPNQNVGANSNLLREKYRGSLNFSMRKYGLASYVRQAHFLGQGAVESAFLQSMQEKSMIGHVTATAIYGTAINPMSAISENDLGHWYGAVHGENDPYYRLIKYASNGSLIAGSYDWRNGNCDQADSQKFRGRGFKQLTGRSNYANYWLYRGWIGQESFTKNWWSDSQYSAHNRDGMSKIPAEITNPELISTIPANCIDSGAWYVTAFRPNVVREIDGDSPRIAVTPSEKTAEKNLIERVTRGINGGLNGISDRVKYTVMIKEVLL